MFGHGYEIPVMVPLCECGRTDAQYDGMLTPDAVTRCRVQLQVDTLAQPQARTAQPLLRMPIGQEDAHNGRHTDPFSAPPRATDAQEPPSACWPEEAWVFVMKDPKDHSRQGMMQIRDLRAGLLLRPPVKGQRPQVIKRITPYPRRRRKNILIRVEGLWYEFTPTHRIETSGRGLDTEAVETTVQLLQIGSHVKTCSCLLYTSPSPRD